MKWVWSGLDLVYKQRTEGFLCYNPFTNQKLCFRQCWYKGFLSGPGLMMSGWWKCVKLFFQSGPDVISMIYMWFYGLKAENESLSVVTYITLFSLNFRLRNEFQYLFLPGNKRSEVTVWFHSINLFVCFVFQSWLWTHLRESLQVGSADRSIYTRPPVIESVLLLTSGPHTVVFNRFYFLLQVRLMRRTSLSGRLWSCEYRLDLCKITTYYS